ncbi:acyl-CoA dehydrogenase family protein [Sphingosinicella soli]|uniref:Acyl-CoA dehydrogenase n=1 Tax=Sphingosinicella soli TaxID=333708 RepID=A0A7W7F6Q2_9SPHN|nr:acyl-CoA dehydrogenase [Sphingosinicella soli]MBB4632571.1 acyl-CoA dehydrogenase [Sphingosinicella soli]
MSWQLPTLPFFEEEHARLALEVQRWCVEHRELLHDANGSFAGRCRRIVASLAAGGLLEYVLPNCNDGAVPRFDQRTICIVREALAYESNLAASLFATQGIGLSPLTLSDHLLRERYIDRARRGESVSAIAISELHSASDVASVETTASPQPGGYRLNGEKVWIQNGHFANHYFVLARSADRDRPPQISAFIVDSGTPGIRIDREIPMIDDCPLSTVVFDDVFVPDSQRIGGEGDGMRMAMAGFDMFRPSVGAAAIGLAKRALSECVVRVSSRRMFGTRMSDLDGVQTRLAEMRADIEAGMLAVYSAAWTADVIGGRRSTEAALAKLIATEAAQRVVDAAVQLFGAEGVSGESVVGRLYRELRPMRIYEGASEIQKKIIARGILRAGAPT